MDESFIFPILVIRDIILSGSTNGRIKSMTMHTVAHLLSFIIMKKPIASTTATHAALDQVYTIHISIAAAETKNTIFEKTFFALTSIATATGMRRTRY